VQPGFRPFLGWLSDLLIDDLELILGRGPDTDRLARRVAHLSASNVAFELLFGRNRVTAEVRGLGYGTRLEALGRLAVGDNVLLEREPENPHDPNAIRVRSVEGVDLGYLAREVARGIAGRLDDGQLVTAEVTILDVAGPELRVTLTLR
jgi:hypothetical protein